MDDSQNPISSHELNLRPASNRPSAVDELPADLASSRTLIARERNDRSRSASTVVYCGSEEDVHEGFLIALNAMGVAVVEEPDEPAKPPVAGVKP